MSLRTITISSALSGVATVAEYLSRIIPCDYVGCHNELTRQWSEPGAEFHYTDPKTCDEHTHQDLIDQKKRCEHPDCSYLIAKPNTIFCQDHYEYEAFVLP